MHQGRLIKALGVDGNTPAATLIDLLRPGLAGLDRIVTYYRQHPSGDNLSVALDAYAKACERDAHAKTPRQAVEASINAAKAYQDLHRYAEAVRCLREAVRCDPLGYEARLRFGFLPAGSEGSCRSRYCPEMVRAAKPARPNRPRSAGAGHGRPTPQQRATITQDSRTQQV